MLSILIWRSRCKSAVIYTLAEYRSSGVAESRPCNHCLLIVKRGSLAKPSLIPIPIPKGRSKGKGRPCGISSTTNINSALGGQKTDCPTPVFRHFNLLSSSTVYKYTSSFTSSTFTAHLTLYFAVLFFSFFTGNQNTFER